jgi:hypothetical protein
VITQLPLGEVGYTVGSTIYIDATAAGWGWYTGLSGVFDAAGQALSGGPAAGHVDLLTVVLHEIGHTLGLADGCACGTLTVLMRTTLAPGQRRLLPHGAAAAGVLVTGRAHVGSPGATRSRTVRSRARHHHPGARHHQPRAATHARQFL